MLRLPPPKSLYSLGWLTGVLGLSEAKEGRPQGLPWRPVSGFLLGLVNQSPYFPEKGFVWGWPQARKLGLIMGE